MPDTNPPSDFGSIAGVALPSAAQIYDMIMANIESDLLTKNIPSLDSRYAGESAEERHARYERYSLAYAKYGEAFSKWLDAFRADVDTFCRIAMRSAEEKDRHEEEALLIQLTTAFDTALPS